MLPCKRIDGTRAQEKLRHAPCAVDLGRQVQSKHLPSAARAQQMRKQNICAQVWQDAVYRQTYSFLYLLSWILMYIHAQMPSYDQPFWIGFHYSNVHGAARQR